MPSVRRRSPLLSLALAALLFLCAASAMATTPVPATYKTRIFMSEKFPAFHGKLHSSYEYCAQDRKVKLYREKAGMSPGPDKLLGTTVSGSDGSWSIPIGDRLIGGAYYSIVTAKTSAELSVACKAAKSQVAVVD